MPPRLPPPVPLMWISHAGKHTQQVCLTATVCLPATIQNQGHLQPKPAAHTKEESQIRLNLKVVPVWVEMQMLHEEQVIPVEILTVNTVNP